MNTHGALVSTLMVLSVVVLSAVGGASCGAGHKIEDGGERVDRAIERDIEHGKREVKEVFTDDGGQHSATADASRAQ